MLHSAASTPGWRAGRTVATGVMRVLTSRLAGAVLTRDIHVNVV